MIEAVALAGLPEIEPGADLAALVAAAGAELRDGDVVVVAHKAVSKAQGRTRRLAEISPGQQAPRARGRARQGSAPRAGDPRRVGRDRARRAAAS